MRMLGLIAGLGLVLAVGSVQAQEPPTAAEEGDAELEMREPLLRIRVLEHPYDLSSFYRAAPRGAPSRLDFSERYPIASFYRAEGARHPQGHSRFWSAGYAGRSSLGDLYRRRIGQHGDLFLLAPTFLAPLGALTVLEADEPR